MHQGLIDYDWERLLKHGHFCSLYSMSYSHKQTETGKGGGEPEPNEGRIRAECEPEQSQSSIHSSMRRSGLVKKCRRTLTVGNSFRSVWLGLAWLGRTNHNAFYLCGESLGALSTMMTAQWWYKSTKWPIPGLAAVSIGFGIDFATVRFFFVAFFESWK